MSVRGWLLGLALLTSCARPGSGSGSGSGPGSGPGSGSGSGSGPGPVSASISPSASSSSLATPFPPAALSCLAQHYSATIGSDAAGFHLLLPDGTKIPWDDGKTKSFEQKLAAPDVEDVFSIAYRGGPIVPVVAVDDDPGRIRLDALFRATYGDSAKAVRAELVPWTLLGQTLVVHRRALPAFQRVGARLEAAVKADPTLAPFLHGLGGTFVWRVIAGTDRQSAHSYGVSLDIDPSRSDYWLSQSANGKIAWRNRIPQAIVDAFEAEKFIWGGRWYHYDTMHFEYRPELFSPCP